MMPEIAQARIASRASMYLRGSLGRLDEVPLRYENHSASCGVAIVAPRATPGAGSDLFYSRTGSTPSVALSPSDSPVGYPPCELRPTGALRAQGWATYRKARPFTSGEHGEHGEHARG